MIDREKVGSLVLPLDRRRILLVEDESQLLSTLSSYLFRAGAWDVWQAHSCERARELWLAHAEQVDVVIADHRLNDANGMDLLIEFSVRKPGLFQLLITGSLVDTYRGPILRKPFTDEMLIASIRAL